MVIKTVRGYFLLVLALLLCQSTASAKTRMGKPSHAVYVMAVDYNPETEQLTGLCQVNGHPCWLLLDTGWLGVALFADRQADWRPEKPVVLTTQKGEKHDQKSNTRLPMSVRLGPLDFFPPKFPVRVIDRTDQFQTSTGQPITGIIGVPFLNIIPTEWDVPAHKIVFWLSGRPKQFLHVPPSAVVVCKQDSSYRLLVPVSVRGRHGEVYFDTGSDRLYVFDYMISDFPAAGPEGVLTGPDMNFRVVPRHVEGLKIGPLVFGGTVWGRLPKHPRRDMILPHGFLGMTVVAHLHLFVVGNKIIFDPNSGHFSGHG